MTALDTLPKGARLALLNWPGGQPTGRQIADAAYRRAVAPVIYPLVSAGLIEGTSNARLFKRRTFRLTQAGRKALDVLMSGVE